MKSSSLQFQIEKRTRSVFQFDEVYKASCFKSHLKNPVAKTSKELVCVSFAAAQDSLCYNFSFGGRRKWPQASRILAFKKKGLKTEFWWVSCIFQGSGWVPGRSPGSSQSRFLEVRRAL